jgi:NAD(P)-dependent dehydrogenase (short-subunit alcohol dehydrogenase family)
LHASVALAKRGFFVIATMRDRQKQAPLFTMAEQEGVADRIEVVLLDVTDPQTITEAVNQTVERYGRIDLLVNNAGYAAGGFVEELPLDEWRQQFETNFFGLVEVTRAVLPHMRSRHSGTIINISSISGRMGFPGLAPYSASKHAVEGFSESLRLEMLPHGIHVVLIEPGSYRTDIWKKGLAHAEDRPASPYREQMKRIAAMTEQIMNKAPEPDEVIAAIVKAAISQRPRLRYPVGSGVRLSVLAKELLPWGWVERIIRKRLGSAFSQSD